ncbi:MAG: hypothetical protein V1750_10320, partial [Acidobacteriota bacterium]
MSFDLEIARVRSSWRGRPLPAGEGKRKLVHAAMGSLALLFPYLTWPQAALCAIAAFLFNWQVLPQLLGHRLASARAGASDRGVLLYPLVVLALILLFRHDLGLAAWGWGVLAFGDAAAGLVGQKWGRRPLPWNPHKSWEGLAAFVVAGGLGGGGLAAWYALKRGQAVLDFPDLPAGWLLWLAVPLALAALLESLPHGLDDNILPAIAVPAVMVLAAGSPGSASGVIALPLVVNTGCAVLA